MSSINEYVRDPNGKEYIDWMQAYLLGLVGEHLAYSNSLALKPLSCVVSLI